MILEAIGGAFLVYLGAQGCKAIPAEPPTNAASQSIRETILVNITNPHMYLFWFAVGMGQLKKPMPKPIWFLLGFYPAIVGKSRHRPGGGANPSSTLSGALSPLEQRPANPDRDIPALQSL